VFHLALLVGLISIYKAIHCCSVQNVLAELVRLANWVPLRKLLQAWPLLSKWSCIRYPSELTRLTCIYNVIHYFSVLVFLLRLPGTLIGHLFDNPGHFCLGRPAFRTHQVRIYIYNTIHYWSLLAFLVNLPTMLTGCLFDSSCITGHFNLGHPILGVRQNLPGSPIYIIPSTTGLSPHS
jgi:hypothetical protein